MANLDDMEPWERYEYLKKQQWAENVADGTGEAPELSASGERLLTLWHQLIAGTFTGESFGATLTTLARLFKTLSDADLLLSKLVGCGAVRTGVWFEPQFALEQAAELEQAAGASDPVIETLRQVAQAWVDGGDSRTPLTPHFLFAALLYWSQGNEFTWATYEAMMPRLFRVTTPELLQRLHMLGDPARQAQVQATIDRVAALPVKVAAPVFVRFENPAWGTKTKDFGPYVWVEIIHDELKVAPTGRHLATLTRADDAEYWVVSDPTVPARQAFTNLVIGPAEVPDGWVQSDDTPEPAAPAGPGGPDAGPGG